jgi:hypothetical protein
MGAACPIKDQIAELKTAIQVNVADIALETQNRKVAEEMANDADEKRMAAAVQLADLRAEKRDLWFKIGVNVAVIALEVGTAGYATGFSMGCKTAVKAGRACVQLGADKSMMDPAAPRSARVEVTKSDGQTVSHFTRHAPWTMEYPIDAAGINANVSDLIAPVLGARQGQAIIDRVNALESVGDIRELVALMTRRA